MSSGAGIPVEDGIHQAAGLEVGAHLRQLRRKPLPHQVHVGKAAQAVALVEPHLHEGGVRGGVGCQNGGEAGGDADVGDDDLQVLLGDDFADDLLDLADQFVGQFQPRAGGRLEVDDKLARIGPREVGLADHRVERQAQDEEAGDAEDRRQAGGSNAMFSEPS